MSQHTRPDRRAFLKNAGMTALAGTVGTAAFQAHPAAAVMPAARDSTSAHGGVPDRFGVECVNWVSRIGAVERVRDGQGTDTIAPSASAWDMDLRRRAASTVPRADRLRRETWGYLPTPPSYAEAIKDWNTRRHGVGVNPDLLVHSDRVDPAVLSSLKAPRAGESQVVVQTPSYSVFYTDIRIVDMEGEQHHEGRYVMNVDALERHIDHATQAVVLCSPQHPTDAVWSRGDLSTLREIGGRHRVVILFGIIS